MKAFKKILFAVMIVVFMFALAACGGNNNSGGGGRIPPDGDKKGNLSPSDIVQLKSLTDYGAKQSAYEKTPVSFNETASTYAGTDCSDQLRKLSVRIEQKKQDVMDRKTTSSFVKIFAKSTPSGLMQRMAQAALSFEEMDRVVDYLYGSAEAPVMAEYLEEKDGVWTGSFTDRTASWRAMLNASSQPFNTGWSLFDDWDLYDRLKDYSESNALKGEGHKTQRENTEDNAAWQYRSILKKVYTEVRLDGDAAARLATYMLDYAIIIVEEQSNGKANDALGNDKRFAEYCKKVPGENEDPFSGLGDYETLSYLLAFNDYYHGNDGLKNCVALYGYYYDYNKTYYFESLADEDTYAKQLKYERMSKYTDEEWLDYVKIQRNNYVKAYRYTEDLYRAFYTKHFEFQTIIEKYDDSVYNITSVIADIGSTKATTTYTKEMKTAIPAAKPSTGLNGLGGQLAMSDWLWCYGGDEKAMRDYNQANSKYEDGKNSDPYSSEAEYEGKFEFEMQQLKMVEYLLTKMTDSEKGGALYYNVYAYSASMVKNMQEDIKKIVYIRENVEVGSEYTSISEEVLAKKSLSESNEYAKGKIKVIYDQTFDSWNGAGVSTLAGNAAKQSWEKMRQEVQYAINYDYSNMSFNKQTTKWKERCTRLEDLVIMREWSCCGQKVHEADPNACKAKHAVANADGTAATKEYATDHTISVFVSNYEPVIYHIAGQATVSFQKPERGFQTDKNENGSWVSGYYGSFATLYNSTTGDAQMRWAETKSITVGAGKVFVEDISGEDDKTWWNGYKPYKDDKGVTKTNQTKDVQYPSDSASDVKTERYNGSPITYAYTYKFTQWYLDKECKYEFDENDEVGVNLNVYAGYNVTKTKQ